MAYIYNATREEQTIKALGNWFTFKPKQMKMLNDDLSSWIASEKKMHGLVQLDNRFEEEEFRQSDLGKQLLAEAEKEGIANYLAHHRQIIANNQVSLRRDLEQANVKADPAAFATEGEIASMKIVARYNSADEDEAQRRMEEVRDLMKKVK